MKEYVKKYGIRVGIIVLAVAALILVGATMRGGQVSLLQNVTGVLSAPLQKVLSSTVNWFDTIYGYLYDYDSLVAENESLRSQLADAQQSARDGIEASEVLKKEIMKYLRGSLASYKRPKTIEFVSALPKTSSGKVRRTEIKEKDWDKGTKS